MKHPAQRLSLAALFAVSTVTAQVPDSPPAQTPAQTPAAGGGQKGGMLGKDVPSYDPGTEILSWDGKNWNVNNNRLFQARFEKYLNAPAETATEDQQYRAIITEVLNRLAPGAATVQNVDYSFRLLQRGSNYDADARLCDSLANAVYTVWVAQRSQQRLVAANSAMQYEIMSLEAATRLSAKATEHAKDSSEKMKGTRRSGGQQGQQGGGQGGGNSSVTEDTAEAKQATLDQGNWQTRRLAEMIARQKANDIKRELSEIQAKIEFQALMVQFFMQRRYQHVIMATRFYRALFNDGDSKLNLGKDATELFQRSTGQPPTVSVLDSLTNEAIRDVRQGVQSVENLVQNNELESASKRLAEAFTMGEYMPEVRTFSYEKKRKVLEFTQKANKLLNAMEIKDYTTAEGLVNDLSRIAKDCDTTKAKAAIETARRTSGFLLLKAKNAALSGDTKTLETAVQQATEIWPLNPALVEVSQKISDQTDVQQQAVIDFDRLYRQKNYRQIYEDSPRFLAALTSYPDKQEQLKGVLENLKTIEAAVLRADEMARQSNYAGAWESVEKAFTQFPDDSRLNQQRASLTTQAADFVRTLRNAQDLEKQDQVGASLAWYLKAQKIYPASDYAGDAIGRLVKKIVPAG